jgi:hypothetical protein
MGVTAMAHAANDNGPFQTTHKQYMMRLSAAAIHESAFGTLASTHDFSATALLNRDYKRCADTMIHKYAGMPYSGLSDVRGICSETTTTMDTISGPE